MDLPTTKKKLQAAQKALSNTERGEGCDIGGSCEGVGEVIANGELNNDKLQSLPPSQEAQSLRLCKRKLNGTVSFSGVYIQDTQ